MNNEEKILAMLSEIKTEMDQRFDKVDERLDKVEGRLDKMDQRFDKVDERLDKVEGRLDKMDQRFDKVDEQLKELGARSLKSAVLLETDVPRDINRLYEAQGELFRKMDTLATKKQVDELASDVDAIKIVVSGHSRDIGKLKKAQ